MPHTGAFTLAGMFDTLSDRLGSALGDLRRKGRLDEESISRAMREIRLALLEADVNLDVVRGFVDRVRERALGEEVLKGLTPGQQVVKVVHEELTELLGADTVELELGPRSVILLAGLQGSGKTTAAAKLAQQLRDRGRKPGLVAADLQRPAAIDQLEQLGAQIGVPVYRTDTADPVEAARSGLARAREDRLDTVIVDTAGRIQIDAELMDELERVREVSSPTNSLLVLDAMTGQQAVEVATRVPGADLLRRRHPDEARRRRPRRRRALGEERHRASRSCSPRPARSSTRSRCSTPTAWPRGSSAWATCSR